jgi:hypothetical protein
MAPDPKYQMKIIEILAADQETPIHGTRLPPHRIPDQDLTAHIANALTRDPAVKLLWDLHMADEVPAPESSREDTGTSQPAGGAGGARVNALVSSSGATRAGRFTPPF